MHVEYKRMLKLLVDRGISVAALRKATGLSTCTFTRIRRNEPVTLSVLLKIAAYLDCRIEDICEFVKSGDEEGAKI